MSIVRLDKYLADSGIGTRSEVKKYIRNGQITINNIVTKSPDIKLNTDTDSVTYLGVPIVREDYVYYLLHKPAGCVSATEDSLNQTVLDLINDPSHHDLFPVGRLDKDTEGLLLITNDGQLAHELLSPKKHVDKTYYLETDSEIPASAVTTFSTGIDIGDDTPTLPAELTLLSANTANITIREGRYHQIKRMLHAVGCEVTYLRRIQMGPLTLPQDMEKGTYRRLTVYEIEALKKLSCSTS